MDLHSLPNNLSIAGAWGDGSQDGLLSSVANEEREKVISSVGSTKMRFRGPLKRHKHLSSEREERETEICPSFFSLSERTCLLGVLL